jgi:hypothetical protein
MIMTQTHLKKSRLGTLFKRNNEMPKFKYFLIVVGGNVNAKWFGKD